MKPFILLIVTLALIGCAASLKDIQSGPPAFSLKSNLSPKSLANQIVYESTQESLKSRFFPDWDPVKAHEIDGIEKLLVTITSRGNILFVPYPPQAVAEITIKAQEGGSLLEYRGISNWREEEKFLAMIKQCASPHENNPGAIVGVKQ